MPQENDFDWARFGANVRHLRKFEHLSTRQLSQRAGVSQNTLLRIEHGLPTRGRCRENVARALGTRFETIYAFEPELGQVVHRIIRREEHRWHVATSVDHSLLPKDFNMLIQDPRERARLSRLGWGARFDCRTVPRLVPEVPGISVMEIWAKSGTPSTHPFVELAYVVRGGVRIFIGDDAVELQEGEGISFRADIPHDYEPLTPLKPGDLPALVLYVLVPLP